MKIHAIDLALIVGYFLLVLFVAFRVSRSVHDSGDYFPAGRTWFSVQLRESYWP